MIFVHEPLRGLCSDYYKLYSIVANTKLCTYLEIRIPIKKLFIFPFLVVVLLI